MRKPVIEVIDQGMADVLRRKTAAAKMKIANSMWCFARDSNSTMLRSEHPDWSAEEIQREVARRLSHETC